MEKESSMSDGLTLNKITSQRGISIGEAARRVADLGWTPSYVQEAMTFPTDYKIKKAPRDPMKQVLRSYFPMQEEKDNRVYGALDGDGGRSGARRRAPHRLCHADGRRIPPLDDPDEPQEMVHGELHRSIRV